MKRIVFSGHSDDTFGWDLLDPDEKRIGGDDHDDCANCTTRGYLVSTPDEGRIVVAGVYGKLPGATWTIGMGQMDEDEPWPAWAQPVWSAKGYTPHMSLLVPDNAEVVLVSIDGKAPEVQP